MQCQCNTGHVIVSSKAHMTSKPSRLQHRSMNTYFIPSQLNWQSFNLKNTRDRSTIAALVLVTSFFTVWYSPTGGLWEVEHKVTWRWAHTRCTAMPHALTLAYPRLQTTQPLLKRDTVKLGMFQQCSFWIRLINTRSDLVVTAYSFESEQHTLWFHGFVNCS